MVATQADHPSDCILFLSAHFVQASQVKQLWQGEHSVEKLFGFGPPVLPIQIECEHFGRVFQLSLRGHLVVRVLDYGAVFRGDATFTFCIFGFLAETFEKLPLDTTCAAMVPLIFHRLQSLQQRYHVDGLREEVR